MKAHIAGAGLAIVAANVPLIDVIAPKTTAIKAGHRDGISCLQVIWENRAALWAYNFSGKNIDAENLFDMKNTDFKKVFSEIFVRLHYHWCKISTNILYICNYS